MGVSPDIKIGLVGFGEVGSTFVRGWREREPRLLITVFDLVWNEQRRRLAHELGVEIASTMMELVEKSTLVIAAVVPQAARDVASAAAPFLGTNHLYVDLTSIGPAKTTEIAVLVKETGAQFAKLALMGAVAPFGYAVPCVASGNGAARLGDWMIPLGMKMQVLNDDPAAAATLKLCRSLFQKGMAALAVEALRVARKNGVEKQVVASLAETWNAEEFEPALNRLVCSSAVSATRRGAELDEAINAFADLGFELPIARATRTTFQTLAEIQARGEFGSAPPRDLSLVLEAMD